MTLWPGEGDRLHLLASTSRSTLSMMCRTVPVLPHSIHASIRAPGADGDSEVTPLRRWSLGRRASPGLRRRWWLWILSESYADTAAKCLPTSSLNPGSNDSVLLVARS